MKNILCLLAVLFLSTQLVAKSYDYKVGDNTYEGYYIDKGKNAPLILLVHDWDGLTDYEIKRAKMLANLGYSVFAADLFGKGIRPTEVKDKKQHTGELYKDRKKMRAILEASVIAAKRLGLNTEKAISMGYCFGGAAVLEQARSGANFKAFASFHGGLATPEGQNYKKTKGKVMVFHGTADSMIKMSEFAALADELEKTKVAHEMITYSGAPHAFSVFGRPSYQKEADEKSWARFTSYLKNNL